MPGDTIKKTNENVKCVKMCQMNFDDYQKEATKTAVYPNIGKNHIYPTLGLAGEAGEVANKVGKAMRDNNNVIDRKRKAEIADELGDVLWFMAQLSTELNVPMSKIAEKNIKKLQSRKKRGKLKGSGDNR